MNDTHIPLLEAAVLPDKKKIKMVYIIGLILFIVAAASAVWGWLFWDEYTELVENVLTGEVSRIGPASIALSWGGIFAIAIPIVYGLMWMSIDLKNPALGANNQGFFINRDGFKKAFLKWNEFERIEKNSETNLWLYMKNPQEIVDRQPGFAKVFLKKTYVTDKSPIVISAEASPEEGRVVELVRKYALSGN